MTFAEAKEQKAALEKAVHETGAVLKAYPRNAMGLVPESVRITPEYQAQRKAYQAAFSELQSFNQVYVVRFAKEIKDERRKRFS
jgi:hypothetical protein